MNPRVQSVTPRENYRLEIVFDNGEVREFDTSPYTEKGFFKELQLPEYFKRASVSLGTVTWPNGQDFCPDMLYEESLALIR